MKVHSNACGGGVNNTIWNFKIYQVPNIMKILKNHKYYGIFNNIHLEDYGLELANEEDKYVSDMKKDDHQCYVLIDQVSQNENDDKFYSLNIMNYSFDFLQIILRLKEKTFDRKQLKWFISKQGLSELKLLHTQVKPSKVILIERYPDIPSSQKHLYQAGQLRVINY